MNKQKVKEKNGEKTEKQRMILTYIYDIWQEYCIFIQRLNEKKGIKQKKTWKTRKDKTI